VWYAHLDIEQALGQFRSQAVSWWCWEKVSVPSFTSAPMR
jgi:hypothetical protein